jgi:hypothetical protein
MRSSVREAEGIDRELMLLARWHDLQGEIGRGDLDAGGRWERRGAVVELLTGRIAAVVAGVLLVALALQLSHPAALVLIILLGPTALLLCVVGAQRFGRRLNRRALGLHRHEW